MKYPFLDVGFGYRSLKNEIDVAYQCVMDSGYYIGRGPVSKFEAEFAEYCGAKYCVGMA
ncbi:DegT/DnrJ/EryC1/StrS family aminotransferase [Falsihalocynthiibacter arcticus]|uniref:DegT/DnrJ/EryC1/StrS family aminotransferase n=1 Tax=Falsihalocynthiibacter arcticus TaxID=1579316 RepID=UPI001C54F36C|nr:DegT/DnrJ/EryC1/StrS family aminotransferase [Falsihalocynthiibacter arcticus]